jgi:hypothetical protein
MNRRAFVTGLGAVLAARRGAEGDLAGISAIIDVTIPGYLILVGVPVTAVAILVVGLVFRTRVGNDPASAVRYGE